MEPLQLKPIQMFFSYAGKDEAYALELVKHLKDLERRRYISTFLMRDISAGENWQKTIDARLSSASLILLLISADFMDSDYCFSEELLRAVEMHRTGQADIIPIIVRPVHWQDTIIGNFQALPKNGKPIQTWANSDEAYFDIAEGVREKVMARLHAQQMDRFPSLPSMPALQSLSVEGSVNYSLPEYQIQETLSTRKKSDRVENEDAKTYSYSIELRIRAEKDRLKILRRQDTNAYYQACAHLSQLAEKARKDEEWEEEGIYWEILREFRPYIVQSRIRRKIVRDNQTHKNIYDEAKQYAEKGDRKATKEKLLELWQKAPFYGDPAKLARHAGLYIPLGGWRRTVWMSLFWIGLVSLAGFFLALIFAGTNSHISQYYNAISGILFATTIAIYVVFFYLNSRWIYLKFAPTSTPSSTTSGSGVNPTRTNSSQNKRKNRS